jgi:hypothetical protein
MSVNVLYATSAIAVGGRDGNTGTSDGRFEVNLVGRESSEAKVTGIIPSSFLRRPTQPAFSAPCRFWPRKAGGVRRMRR